MAFPFKDGGGIAEHPLICHHQRVFGYQNKEQKQKERRSRSRRKERAKAEKEEKQRISHHGAKNLAPRCENFAPVRNCLLCATVHPAFDILTFLCNFLVFFPFCPIVIVFSFGFFGILFLGLAIKGHRPSTIKDLFHFFIKFLFGGSIIKLLIYNSKSLAHKQLSIIKLDFT